MITIHLGCFDPPNYADTVVIQQVDDYIRARQTIRHGLSQVDVNMDVYVKVRTCDEWFWDLEGFPGVILRQEDQVTLLRKRLRVAVLPPELDDPVLIERLGLLNLPPPSTHISDPIAWTLGKLLNPLWAEERPSYEHLTRLIAWWVKIDMMPGLQPLLAHRLNVWRDQGDGLLRDAYARLQENPQKVMRFLCCWRALAPYETNVRRRWLEEERWYLPGLQEIADRLGPLPLPVEAERTMSLKAEAYWNSRLLHLNRETQE